MIKKLFKDLNLRTKFLVVGVLLTLVPLLVFGAITYTNSQELQRISRSESLKLAYTDLDHIALNVYAMAEAQQKLLEKTLLNYLNVARKITQDLGKVEYQAGKTTWQAVNQYTKSITRVDLPRFAVGGGWFGQVTDPSEHVAVVDDLQELAPGVTCTVFQRMNAAGDMLRVATNVLKTNGSRAIGTYIPRTNPDGKPNPVISTVLRGQTFNGRAYVVNKWYITAYEPIYINNKIAGVLYVGIPQEATGALRQAIMNIKVGKTGYVYVLDSEGHYVISQKGQRDGELLIDAKDSDGNFFIREMVQKSVVLKPGEFAEQRYPWKNPGDPKARYKVARLLYFQAWDWIIGAGSYEEDFLESTNRMEAANRRVNMVMSVVAAISGVLAILVWVVVARGVANPIASIAATIRRIASERDLTRSVPVPSRDEIGRMARDFNNMIDELNRSFKVVDNSAAGVATYADDVAQRASANRNRANNEQKRTAEIFKTVRDMGTTAGEVATFSNEQAEVAMTSKEKLNTLLNMMEQVADTSSSQVQEAKTASDRVEAMGETGAKVVASARQQGDAVKNVTAAIDRITQIVEEMTKAATESTEHGKTVLAAASEGARSVNATVEGMGAISESSAQISEIIAVITEIAEQTNLLALNAAIEAARAGAHGKGFAVVADEVGKLAQRSSEAAKEITQLIKNSTESVSEGTKLTDQSQLALQRISEGGEINMRAIEGITEKTGILAGNIQEVNSMMQELNALAEQIGTMAGQQGERRKAAKEALDAMVGKANQIAELVHMSSQSAQAVGKEMEAIVLRTEKMQEMTTLQAERSKRLSDATQESARGAKQTMEGAGTVVQITEELQSLSKSLTDQVKQFKIRGNGDLNQTSETQEMVLQ